VTSLPILGEGAPHVAGQLERSLADLWGIARTRVDTLSYWRETIALRRRFSLRFLKLGELKVAVPYATTPNCDDCVDLCCTGPNAIVSLRLRDIAALVDAGRESFIVPRSGDPPRESTWARREADGSVFHQVFPVLLRDATGTCALLREDRMCGAFPSWPLSCARYPYALDLQLKTVFWAKGCASTTVLPSSEAPLKVRELLRAVVDAYNERVKDAILLYVARRELGELGLLRFLDVSAL
jgi:hypothetical protein